MIVDQDLLDHPKYRRYRRRLLGRFPGAQPMEYLVRIWGHCQGNKRGEWWPGKTAQYVEDIAGWDGEEGQLAAALAEQFENGPGWIEIEAEGIRIHGWDEMNNGLICRWRNGEKGGRPKNRPQTNDVSPDNRLVNHPQTSGSPDRTREDRIGEEGTRAREASPENPDEKSAPPHIPSLEEVIEQGAMPGCGVPEEYCRHFHQTHENDRLWLNGQNVLKDWRKRLKSWWEKDRERWSKKRPGKKGGREEIADLEAQLQLAKQPEAIERIRRRLEDLRG